MIIYHILHKRDAENIQTDGLYGPESFQKEGFIHCSKEDQVLPTANRRYSGQNDLQLLVIDTDKVLAKIITEDTSGRGEKHPHIYGRLNQNAIVEVRKLEMEKDGSFVKFPTKYYTNVKT
jgi:uncharacterized protein (DUF952 family)